MSAPVTLDELEPAVRKAVAEQPVVDLHTHLLPPSFDEMMLWGVDELLTYHYLTCEFFQTATDIKPDEFFALPKDQQGDMIWDALFVKRSPISEQCRGVITTLTLLGLGEMVQKRDIKAIRAWFASQDPESYTDLVMKVANIKYVVMTNIPFDTDEVAKWKAGKTIPSKFKAALRIDPLLAGNWDALKPALEEGGYPLTPEGCKQFLRDWAKTMNPLYLMASTPAGFCYGEDDFATSQKGWLACCAPSQQFLLEQPGAKVDIEILGPRPKRPKIGPPPPDDGKPWEPQGDDLITQILMPLAMELNLPIAMKFGAMRGVNPSLRTGQDAVDPSLDNVSSLRRLCTDYPKVKFCATFLSRDNQHEATVLANKFSNLHLYGCWWFCNNPSIIQEMTAQRLEILGTEFTCQHSDARVLDQLLYKWNHSRTVVGTVLVQKYKDLIESGWALTNDEIVRDVEKLFGGSFEAFCAKDSSNFEWTSQVVTLSALGK